MASVNNVQLLGNVGKDPEIRYLPSGDPVASFSLATTDVWKDKSGAKQERTEWHRLECFGGTAKVVQEYVTKGKQLYVEGSIRYDEWTDKDGNKKNMTKIKVHRLVLLGGGGERGAKKKDVQAGGTGVEIPAQAGGNDDIPF